MTKGRTTRGNVCIHLRAAADKFCPTGRVGTIAPIGNGNVNDTFLVSCASTPQNRFILQRINARVFTRPESIMQNLRKFCDHVSKRLVRNPVRDRRWEMPKIFMTSDSKDHWIDPEGCFWRGISYIEGAESFDSILDHSHASEVGFALGLFHSLSEGLPAEELHDTLEGFHITPNYLRRYLEVLQTVHVRSSREVDYCLSFIEERKEFAHILENAGSGGKLPLRIIHGDPKVGNVMIDTRTRLAVSMVDLDTVKPGLALYDIGDCLRSGCNPMGEDPGLNEKIRFDPELCRSVLGGYFSAAEGFLTDVECGLIYDSARLLAFELGMRFFTDFLEGDIYFKVRDSRQNLRRAIVQFRLTESIESQADCLRTIINETKVTLHNASAHTNL